MIIRQISFLSLFVLLVSGLAYPLGERSNIRGVGMGRTFVSVSKGLDAAGMNPANLGLDTTNILTIGLAPAGFNAGGDVLSYDVYTTYFKGDGIEGGTARHLEDVDKEYILSEFGEGFSSSHLNVDARLLGVSLRLADAGVLAFTITDYAGATFSFSEDFARFVLYGNPLGSSYDLTGTALSANWIRAYGLSFGTVIPVESGLSWLAIGGGAKVIHGYAHYEIVRSESRLETSQYGVLNGDIDFLAKTSESSTLKATGFDLFPIPAGEGWGLDFGLSAGISDYISIGMSITDIGSVNWTSNTEEVYTDTILVIDNPLDPEQQEAVLHAISGSEFRKGDSFETRLPTTVRAGFAIELHKTVLFDEMAGQLLFGVDYHQALYTVPGTSTRSRISFGTEYLPVSWLPLRAGVSVGGTTGTNIAAGFGIRTGPVSLDFASDNIGWVFAPSHSSYGSLSMGATLTF